MPKFTGRFLLLTCMLIVFPIHSAFPSTAMLLGAGKSSKASKDKPPQAVTLPESYTSDQIDQILARLSDDQVRQLLITELQKSAANASEAAVGKTESPDFQHRLANLVDSAFARMLALAAHLPQVPRDFQEAFGRLKAWRGGPRLGMLIAIMLLILAAGFGAEKLFQRSTGKFRQKVESIPSVKGFVKVGSAVLKILPKFMGILVFAICSLILAQVVFDRSDVGARLFFTNCLSAIVIARLASAVSRMLCSPQAAQLRLLPLSDQAAALLHKNLAQLIRFMAVVYTVLVLFKDLSLEFNSYVLLILALGTAVLLMVGRLVWKNRMAGYHSIIDRERGQHLSESRQWFRQHLAGLWHVLALAYLFLIWLVWVGRILAFGPTFDHAFIISLLIVPIFFAVDRIGQWLTASAIGTLPLPGGDASDNVADLAEDAGAPPEKASAEEVPEAVHSKTDGGYIRAARLITRVIIILVLAFWLMGVWGIDLPFGEALIRTVFKIFMMLVIAHIAWGFTNKLINRKLEQSQPADAEHEDAEEGEWGAGTAQDRSQTLLPMLRKFIGSVLALMVTLTVLSSLGVDIAPLLAGAGVLGLAIGFGAQKLVRDILSGFFFLIDDAFRVGEYIQAGKIEGTVEAITLRNVMLRHSRGMLQIVPYSDLGTITNFMRGGIVVKFNLELPYDTDIDKVRKVVKNVGQEMLEDEEMRQDIIKPLKSQGVRDVTGSVLTFRVKFTAKAGTHFVIRREAYKRITEALAKKGIHYAVRKVIVDIPNLEHGAKESDEHAGKGQKAPASPEPDLKSALYAAGAAAALATQQEESTEDSTDEP